MPAASFMEALVQRHFMAYFSRSLKVQSTGAILSLLTKSFNIMAAETDMFKLSVNPCIGIVNVRSASCINSGLIPFFSVPKTKADFCLRSKVDNCSPWRGLVATIC